MKARLGSNVHEGYVQLATCKYSYNLHSYYILCWCQNEISMQGVLVCLGVLYIGVIVMF